MTARVLARLAHRPRKGTPHGMSDRMAAALGALTSGAISDTSLEVGMGRRIEDLVAAMRSNPVNVRFDDACRVATHFFGNPRASGSSHLVWKMPWPGDPRINLQRGESGKAKAYQVRQLLFAIDRLRQEDTP